MKAALTTLATATLLSAVFACGGNVDLAPAGDDHTGSGAGGTGGGLGGTGGDIPDECRVETSLAPPYAVTFRFHNPTGELLFLRETCTLQYDVSSCADGYAQPWALWPGLSADCSDPQGGCVASEACSERGIPVSQGQVWESSWTGLHYTFGTNADDCVCHDEHDAPAGRYRITVSVYASEQAAQDDDPLHHSETSFELPPPSGIVDVALVAY